MAELTAGIGANDKILYLDEALPSGTYFRIGEELIAVTGRTYRSARWVEPDGTILSVKRGMYGTTKAAHAEGAEVSLYVEAVATPTPFAGGGDVVQAVLSRTTVLTDAQIKALPTTPVELLPSPGADAMNAILMVVIRLVSEAAYTNLDGSVCLLRVVYANSSEAVAGYDENLMAALGSAANANIVMPPWAAVSIDNEWVVSGAWADSVDQALSIDISNNAAGNLTGGHANNSMAVTVLYTTIDFT